jgi:molybdopterin molybdotransferase
VEDVRIEALGGATAGETATLRPGATVKPGQAIHPRGSDYPAGRELLACGVRLEPRHLAIAASVGALRLAVAVRPRVILLVTGSELVAPEERPEPHQVRRSNDRALIGLMESRGGARVELRALADDEGAVWQALVEAEGKADLVVSTGGVSQGQFDPLPGAVKRLGAEWEFRGVAQRPGKPLAFACLPGGLPLVALPGNPVSATSCAVRYLLPYLAAMQGRDPAVPERLKSVRPVVPLPRLEWMVPCCKVDTLEGTRLEPFPANTSGDFATLGRVDGLMYVPPGERPVEGPFRYEPL